MTRDGAAPRREPPPDPSTRGIDPQVARTSRRRFLTVAALGAAAAAAGGLALGPVRWWNQPPEAPYRYVSADEVVFLDALAEAAFPAGGTPALGGAAAAVPRYLDLVLAGLVGTQRSLIRLSMHAMDNLARLSHGVPFHALPPDAAQAQLRAWLASPSAAERGLAQSLHLFVAMAYTAHPAVAPTLSPWFTCGFGLEGP